MIILRLKGGLGNQMFQYIAGLRMSKKYSEELKLDITDYDDDRHVNSDTPRKYRMNAFNLSYGEIASNDDSLKYRNPYGILSKLFRAFNQRVLKNTYIDYHPDYFKSKKSYIEGYFQSEKNFGEIRDIVVNEFRLKKEFEGETFKKEVSKIINNKSKSVSLHIRRGDYANDKITNSYFGTCSKGYYDKAMLYMKEKIENPVFYFFSDDINWAKKEFGESNGYFFVSNPQLQDYEEIILMSLCSNNIIANSSFSWWGAWLNENHNKIVVAPRKWLNVEPSPCPNILPDTWITL